MAQWIVCPSCNLRHSRRADGRCPRCRETVDRDAVPTGAAPIEPGRKVPPPGASLLGETWLARACRARAVRALSTAVGLLMLGLFLTLGQARYLRNFFGGPYPTTTRDLDAITDAGRAPRCFVHVDGTRAVELGLEEYEIHRRNGQETSRRLKARFYALETGDRFLVVKTSGSSLTAVEGELRPVYGELETHLFSTPQMRAARARFRPYFLDTSSFRESGYWGLGLGSVFFLAVGAWALHAWKRLRAPSEHPLVARLSQWGDPSSVSAQVEQELAHPWRKAGAFALTERFLVKSSFYGIDVLRFCDLLWAYKKVTKKSVNFIPVGKDFHAVLACVGGTAEVQAKDADVDEILRYAAARAPWAVQGHSKELEAAFRKDPTGFVAAIAERRRKYESEQAAAPAP